MIDRVDQSLTELRSLEQANKAINPINANINLFKKITNQIKKDINKLDKQSKTMPDFAERTRLYLSVNPTMTEANIGNTLRAVNSIGNIFTKEVTGLPASGNQSLVKEVIRERTMDLVKNVGEDTRGQLRQILEQSINAERGRPYAKQEMTKTIDGMSKTRAEMIARTETKRALNEATRVKAHAAGKMYWIVVSAADCCDECYEAYDGNTFHDPEDEDMWPPLHPNCGCDQVYYREEDLAESAAEDQSNPREDEEEEEE
jgi:hypothetical protein